MGNMVAVIDLGTNTFQFVIADVSDGKFKIVFEKSLAPKIGKGGINKNVINDEAMVRATEALTQFIEIARKYNIESNKIYAFGTSAIRNARNGAQFQVFIKQKLDLNIQIIDGNMEADLICAGVKYAVAFEQEPYLVMDIGGGSVEFIIANKNTLFWKKSIEIGGQRLMEMFGTVDPIPNTQIKKLQSYLAEQLISLSNAVHQYSPSTLVGSAGSFETLVDIFNASKQPLFAEQQAISSVLPIESFYQSFYQFLENDRDKRMKIPGMIELRVDMIGVASILIDFCIKYFHLNRIIVSNYALKEGVLSYLARDITYLNDLKL